MGIVVRGGRLVLVRQWHPAARPSILASGILANSSVIRPNCLSVFLENIIDFLFWQMYRMMLATFPPHSNLRKMAPIMSRLLLVAPLMAWLVLIIFF